MKILPTAIPERGGVGILALYLDINIGQRIIYYVLVIAHAVAALSPRPHTRFGLRATGCSEKHGASTTNIEAVRTRQTDEGKYKKLVVEIIPYSEG